MSSTRERHWGLDTGSTGEGGYVDPVSLELDLETADVAAVSAAMASGTTTSAELVEAYLGRIAMPPNPLVNAIRCLAPDALDRAAALDAERRDGRVRGPLHGVPVLLKDNIDVAGLPTTAGALALEHSVPDRDAGLVVRLREAGAVVIGKTNLTELANCMTENMPSGYSSLGGQVLNPYDLSRTPSGSSSGSGRRPRLGLATVTVGTETEGSILTPANHQSLVGLKPTLGLVPGDGILPIATSQDCAGPMCRTVADAAALLGVLAGETYGEGSGADTLRGVRLAVPPNPETSTRAGPRGVPSRPLELLRERGAIPSRCASRRDRGVPELPTSSRATSTPTSRRLPEGAPIRTMRELVAWNEAHADQRPQVSGRCCSRRRWPSTTTPSARPTSDSVPRTWRWRASTASMPPSPPRTPCRDRLRRARPAAGSRREPATRAWPCRPGTAARTAGPAGASASSVRHAARDSCSPSAAAYEEAAQGRRPPSVDQPVAVPRRRRIAGHC